MTVLPSMLTVHAAFCTKADVWALPVARRQCWSCLARCAEYISMLCIIASGVECRFCFAHKIDDTASSLRFASSMHCRLFVRVSAASGNTTFAMLQTSAACCGLYAYRPTRGAISREGVNLIAGDLDAVGWICRTPDLLPRLGDAFNLPGGETQHLPYRSNTSSACFLSDIVPSLVFLKSFSCSAYFPNDWGNCFCRLLP